MKLRRSTGFTLIELLVVISIIGVLASVVLVSLNSARGKARDAKRRGDLRQLATALALYYDANNNRYPDTGSSFLGTCQGTSASSWIPNLVPTYIAALPADPKPVGTTGCYLYVSNGVDYKLLAYLTVESTVSSTDPMFDPFGLGRPNTYVVYTPGAAAW